MIQLAQRMEYVHSDIRGELYRGERIAIETVVEREGHRWGRLTDGRWIALTYTSD